ncbi:hypothetical protein GUJ93_ZPchr0004g40035 [Zizania palustris]|uniref:Uncharacterized protein n=1 Tax=Zizania palustris TaxID=103762 RepID=A0A8J5VEX7_ZIZPA|nr:hypothetical protein GUJ93_ZPchr0004g40035 [Zizania palustris]
MGCGPTRQLPPQSPRLPRRGRYIPNPATLAASSLPTTPRAPRPPPPARLRDSTSRRRKASRRLTDRARADAARCRRVARKGGPGFERRRLDDEQEGRAISSISCTSVHRKSSY